MVIYMKMNFPEEQKINDIQMECNFMIFLLGKNNFPPVFYAYYFCLQNSIVYSFVDNTEKFHSSDLAI